MISFQDITFSFIILSLLMALYKSAVFALSKRGGESKPHNNLFSFHDLKVCLVGSSRIRELHKRGGYEDLNSQLPDDILVSIIARTPTKLAVSTSILSRRWRNLYKSVSSLDLTCTDLVSRHTLPHQNIHSHDSAIQRLERFLRLCSDSKFHCFQLTCCLSKSCLNQFEQCIHYLGKSGVEELKLTFGCETRRDPVSFSCHLLSKLPSLKYLSLACSFLQPTLNTKCYSLQTLDLYGGTLVPASLECILSNCLELRSLTISYTWCPLKLRFCSPNLQLNTLRIMHCEYIEEIEEIELHASYLTTFEFRSPEMVNFVFDHVPMLETVYLSVSPNWENIMPYVWGKLCEDLPHLKSLTFHTRGFFDQDNIGLVSIGMETFSNLKRLVMDVCCSSRTNLLALIPFLESCPLLEEFHFDARNMDDYDVAVERKHVVFLHTKLKMVEMTGFCGTDNEIEMALYILKAAIALEQMFVIRCVRYYIGCGTWMRKSKVPSRWNPESTPWKEETRNKIEKRLQGQALSNTANLIIQHESIFFTTIHHEVEPWGS